MSKFVDKISNPGSRPVREGEKSDPQVQQRVGAITVGVRLVTQSVHNTFPEIVMQEVAADTLVQQTEADSRAAVSGIVAKSAVQQTMQGQDTTPAEAARY